MGKVIEWAAFLLAMLAVAVLAGPSSLGGPASYVIVDGRSMEPTYEHGDLVIAYERGTYEVGDVIVYDAPVDSQFNVIHRITERTEGGFITQGDNRDEVDGWIAPDEEIFGAALFHIPNGGAIINFLRQPTTILAIGAGWVTLILMERPQKGANRGGANRGGASRSLFTGRQKPNQPAQRRRRRPGPPACRTDAPDSAARWSRTARKAAERADRQKKRGAVATLSVAALGGLSGAVFFAHAASLTVNAGVLQSFHQHVDIEPPPAPEHTITVYAHFFDSGDPGKELGRSPFVFEPVLVTAGQSYEVTWNGPPGRSEVVDCTSDRIDFLDELPDHTYQGIERILPEHDADHLLCIQTAPGNVPANISFELFNGDGVEVELTPSDDAVSEGPEPSGTEADRQTGDQTADDTDEATSEVSGEDTPLAQEAAVSHDEAGTRDDADGSATPVEAEESGTPDGTEEHDSADGGSPDQDAAEEDAADDAEEEQDPDEEG